MRLIDAEKLKREVKEHCNKLIDEGVKEVDVVDIAAEIVQLVDAQHEAAKAYGLEIIYEEDPV